MRRSGLCFLQVWRGRFRFVVAPNRTTLLMVMLSMPLRSVEMTKQNRYNMIVADEFCS
jgi:hypothetical protein